MSTGWGPPSVPRPADPGRDPAAPRLLTISSPPPQVAPAPRPPRVRRSLVALLVVAIAAGAGAVLVVRSSDDTGGDGTADGWERHELPGGAVSVEMPGAVDSESGTVWSGPAAGLSGSALWTGDGGLERAAPGVVVVEGDASQVGLDATAVDRLGPTLVNGALDAFFDEVGAVPIDPPPDGEGDGRTGRRIGGSTNGEELVVVATAMTSGTRVVGIIVTVPAAEAETADALLDRVTASVEVDA